MQLFIKLLRKLIFILLIFIGVLYFSGYGYLVDMGFTIIRTGRAGAGIDDYKYFYTEDSQLDPVQLIPDPSFSSIGDQGSK